jgi:hypothetical protein
MNLIFRTVNFTLAAILRSPLHGLLSRKLLLITVIGRRSQRTYTVPVIYQQHDRDVRILSERSDRWWRNLRGGAAITLHMRGHIFHGQGDTIEEVCEVLPPLTEYLQSSANSARMLNVKRDPQGQFNRDDLRRAAERSVVVRVILA